MTATHVAVERGCLAVSCYKCTRVGRYYGSDRSTCDEMAFKAGWVDDGGRMICPRCPAAR